MKAIYITKFGKASEVFETRESSTLIPKDHEVLIEVSCFGLNYADVMCRKGMYPDFPKLPAVPGYEVVGKIISAGKNVDSNIIGKRVVAFTRFGGYASHVVADPRGIAEIPPNISDAEATALATQYCTAYYAVEEMIRLHQGDVVLIHAAAGGVGTALIQLCKRHKCFIIGTAGSDEKCGYVLKQGAEHAINYLKNDFSAEVKKILGEKKVDVVFDSVGGSVFRKSYHLLGAGGRIVGFGAAGISDSNKFIRLIKGAIGFGFFHAALILRKSKSIIGVYMLPVAERKPEILQRCLNAVITLATNGEIKPHVGGTFKATQISDAHEFLESRKSVGKVVVEW